MTTDWVDVSKPSDLATQLGIDAEEVCAAYSTICSAAMMLPDSELWWRTEDIGETGGDTAGVAFDYQVLQTRMFLNVTEARKMWADLVIIGIVFAATANWPLAAALAAARKLGTTLRMLSEDEAELVGVIRGKCLGNPYRDGVPTSAITAAYRGATVNVLPLLDALEGKQIIKRMRPDSVVLVL